MSVRLLSVAVPCAWGLAVWSRHGGFYVMAVLLTLGLAMDLRLLRRINKGLAAEPNFLKKKVPWT